MASYTNLASLAGLQVGDVVTYTVAQSINFKKYKVKVELYGKAEAHKSSLTDSNPVTVNGGKTQFDLDTKSLSSQTLTYTPSYGSSLCYGSSADAYYRIGVAGNAGVGPYVPDGRGTQYGKGGGTIGEGAIYDASHSGATYYGVSPTGGTQTAGGTAGYKKGSNNTKTNQGTDGSFGLGGAGYSNGTYNGGAGGDGWYGGGGAGTSIMTSQTNGQPGGGGSGFAIGQSTTTYPSGYMGDNSSDITALAAAVSNATLTQGGSSESSAKMVLTILEVPNNFPKYYNGSAWIDTEWKRWNGSAWEDIEVKYYNGTSWV